MTAHTDTDSPAGTFAQTLRERSYDMHQQAEGASFTASLLDGEVSQDGYAAMVAQHLHIYTALEAVADVLRNDPIAGRFITERLNRAPELHRDLQFLLGPDWRREAEMLPATVRYVARIHEIADWPAGFVAHHYTRYLGDLSGGLAIGKRVARAYQLPEGSPGVSFYRFTEIESPKRFKDTYRAELDTLPWTAAERERVIDEVLRAYRHNTEVFAELANLEGLT
jgi:heme oxygenase